jgi:hypothetical protein
MSDDVRTMFMARLKELAGLKAGWYDGDDGLPIDPKSLKTAELFLTAMTEARVIDRPLLYPTLDGNIQTEFVSNGPWTIEIKFVGESAELGATNLITKHDIDETFDLSTTFQSLKRYLISMNEVPDTASLRQAELHYAKKRCA